MKIDLDILAVATQLVGEFGDRAVGFCHARLVEHVAVNNLRAADFWRQAMQQAELIVREGPTSVLRTRSDPPVGWSGDGERNAAL